MDIDKLILSFMWRGKKPRIANKKEKNKVGGLMLPYVKAKYKATVIKTVGYW